MVCCTQNYLVAVVVPNFETVSAWANANGLGAVVKAGPNELVKNEKVRKLVLRAMNQLAEQEKLRGFEVVKDIHLVATDFTYATHQLPLLAICLVLICVLCCCCGSVDNGLLTPSFKLKRHQCVKTFDAALTEMYKRTNAALAAGAPADAKEQAPIQSKL